MIRIKKVVTLVFCMLLASSLTSCFPRDDPWHPYYYEEYEIDAEIIAAYETEPSNEYILIPDTGCRFILEIDGEKKSFNVDETVYHSYKEGDTIHLRVEKKYKKDNDMFVSVDYYLVE